MQEDIGFYLLMLQKRDAVDSAVHQCYSQLLSKLGYFNSVKVSIDGETVPLTQDLMSAAYNPSIPSVQESSFIFRGSYIKAFNDGSLLVKLIRHIAAAMGNKLDEFEARLQKADGKGNHELRTVYWYIDKVFVSKMPPVHQVSFTVDCLMFGSWQCNSPNVIGIHLVTLACMLDIKQFHTFLPPDLVNQACITKPPFLGFLDKQSISLAVDIEDVKKTAHSAGAGAGVAKAVEKVGANDARKSVMNDSHGNKDARKSAMNDSHGNKDAKKSVMNDSHGNKDAKKSLMNDSHGNKDARKSAMNDSHGNKDVRKSVMNDSHGNKDAKKSVMNETLSSKDAMKGISNDSQSAKDAKKGMNNDSQSAKDAKKGMNNDSQSAKDAKKGMNNDSQSAKDAKNAQKR